MLKTLTWVWLMPVTVSAGLAPKTEVAMRLTDPLRSTYRRFSRAMMLPLPLNARLVESAEVPLP